jgi:hypothetical protein
MAAPGSAGLHQAFLRMSGEGRDPGWAGHRDLEAGLKAPGLLLAVTCSCAH